MSVWGSSSDARVVHGVLYVWMLPYKAEDEVEEENKSIDIQA